MSSEKNILSLISRVLKSYNKSNKKKRTEASLESKLGNGFNKFSKREESLLNARMAEE